ncbi:MAG: ATP cone domain-containing protein [Patescibacteria group bacterium]|nr:ATP cone domain-containing protein [Patescibacteria group bacterium]
MLIAKADGTTEEFEPQKLVSSLKRAGAKPSVAESIARDIEQELWDGMSTEEIYSRAFARLREHRHGVAARYSLKRAVLDFGPSGFPFEDYMGELFRAEGNKASVRKLVQGKCVEHEVDVVVEDEKGLLYVEAKFHNAAGFKTDLKVVLYVHARVDDIGGGRGMVATNTKFTGKAIEYASCKGLELLSWDYPQGATLHDRIDKAGLYPVTALTSLSKSEKTALLSQQTVLCKTLPEHTDVLGRAGVSGKKVDQVLEEVGALCVPGKGL